MSEQEFWRVPYSRRSELPQGFQLSRTRGSSIFSPSFICSIFTYWGRRLSVPIPSHNTTTGFSIPTNCIIRSTSSSASSSFRFSLKNMVEPFLPDPELWPKETWQAKPLKTGSRLSHTTIRTDEISCFIACEVIRLTAWGIFAVASDYFKSIGSALGFTRGLLRSDVLR